MTHPTRCSFTNSERYSLTVNSLGAFNTVSMLPLSLVPVDVTSYGWYMLPISLVHSCSVFGELLSEFCDSVPPLNASSTKIRISSAVKSSGFSIICCLRRGLAKAYVRILSTST